MLTPALERELIADHSPPWRENLVDAIAVLDMRAADAILTTLELRAIVRGLSEHAQPDLPVLSFQELPTHTPVVPIGEIDLPAGTEARVRASLTKIETPAEIAEGFGLLLADGKLGTPALSDLLPDDQPPPEPPDAPHRAGTVARDPIAKPDSLAHQGWALLIPATQRGDEMRRAIAKLERYRCDVQSAAFDVFKISQDYSNRPRVWIQEKFEAVPQLQRPRYVLILGDFSDVSLELQLALAPLASVGRLAFETLAEFTAYAEKAVAAELQPLHDVIQPCVFAAQDGTQAASIAQSYLVAPSVERIQALGREQKRRIAPIRVIQGGKAELLESARDANFLFSSCHGAGTNMGSYADRRALQGSLLTSIGEFVTADDVAAHPFLPNGMWFMLACYGLGTPKVSSYAPWIESLYRRDEKKEQLRQIIEAGQLAAGEQPFVAALPKKALANPQGPLAVIGHVDLAWSYAFKHDSQSRFDRLFFAMRVLLHGRIAGLALEQIAHTYLFVSDQLGELYAQYKARNYGPDVDSRDLARMWMLRQDLRNYILLGDPAARLTLTERRQ